MSRSAELLHAIRDGDDRVKLDVQIMASQGFCVSERDVV